jgi:hypothetical protein
LVENNSCSEEELALKDFLLDIDCLDPLAEWTRRLNMFDILKITRTEIRHSNILSWLLNPNENHGLSDNCIKGIIQFVVTSYNVDLDVFETLLMDCHNFIVQREWRNIDILMISPEEKFLICIENKIDTGEHDNQLIKYRKIVDDTYPDYKKIYIYLSPEGSEPSDIEFWYPMGYQDLLDIIENARNKVKLLPDAELMINNYIEAIRRDIVGDERLIKICSEIYAKHQKALDLIFENKPDRAFEVAEIFRKWAIEKTEKGEIEVVLDKCTKTYTRFKTKFMSELLPDAKEARSGWNAKNHYFYELKNIGGNEFMIQLVLSSRNISDELLAVCERINTYFPSRQQKVTWLWRTPFSTKKSKIGDEVSEEKIFEQLDKKIDELKAFESELRIILEQMK